MSHKPLDNQVVIIFIPFNYLSPKPVLGLPNPVGIRSTLTLRRSMGGNNFSNSIILITNIWNKIESLGNMVYFRQSSFSDSIGLNEKLYLTNLSLYRICFPDDLLLFWLIRYKKLYGLDFIYHNMYKVCDNDLVFSKGLLS